MLLDGLNIHESWNGFLNQDIKKELELIEGQIGDGYTPSRERVLRFLELDLKKCKVVILGQDPYKPEGVATGRSFEPADLNNWNDKFRQVSLKNIVRLIYKDTMGITKYEEIPNFSEIQKKIETGEFKIKQPHDWFDSLESQGVLFLNTTLTCKIGESNSHKDIWSKFSDELIEYISKININLDWFLWGKEAVSQIKNIRSGRLYRSNHPMMCSEKYIDDFLKGTCFKETRHKINWLG